MDDGAIDDDNDHLLVVVPLPFRVAQIVKNIGSITYLRDMILEIIFVNISPPEWVVSICNIWDV